MKIKIYCDESRVTNAVYRLVGGIWIRADYGWPFVNHFHQMCKDHVGNLPGHMKWKNVPSKSTSQYMRFYTDLVDIFFDYNKAGHMFFRTVVVDPSYQYDHAVFNNGDPEEGFYKLYYQLLYRTIRLEHEYHIRLAYRDVSKKVLALDESARLAQLKNALNQAVRRDNNYPPVWPVKSIASRFAKSRVLIQLADILMGATGYYWNKFDRAAGANEGKVFLATYIANKLGRADLRFTTPPNDRCFNIFYFNPKK